MRSQLDIASQGTSVSEARENLKEAIELFYETAPEEDAQHRLLSEVYVTRTSVCNDWLG